VKKVQYRQGVVALVIAGLLMWSGYSYAVYTGKLNDYRPLHLTTRVALTAINPGCWIGYGIAMWKGR
jgi:hypothetical protein